MVNFAHFADVHLGGWRQGPMQDLNFMAFQKVVKTCIERKVDFVLIAGDLFDSAYPPIEILKETFAEFKKLKDAKIPVFIIAGSHDYSISGKTFLDVLEKAGFCKNVFDAENRGDEIRLSPVVHNGVAIYGYPGKKSGLEVPDIKKIKLEDAPGMFKILMLHTTLDKVRGVLPIECVEMDSLPEANYYALGHIHVDFKYKNLIYPGPVFPNNFTELETVENGSFYIIDTELLDPFEKIEIKLKEIEIVDFDIKKSSENYEKIINELQKRNLLDKIVLLRISGELENQKISDLKLEKIENYCFENGAYFFLKNTHDLKTSDIDFNMEVKNKDNLEEEAIKIYSKENPSEFNNLIPQLMNVLSIEKQEGETIDSFNTRLLEDSKKVLNIL
ncbi:DNA repair exonuclease [Candidatus Pacearchaeota archaeon]|nr:DNA repair exonuclease [Candidatus Pacearchaeota archaeon]